MALRPFVGSQEDEWPREVLGGFPIASRQLPCFGKTRKTHHMVFVSTEKVIPLRRKPSPAGRRIKPPLTHAKLQALGLRPVADADFDFSSAGKTLMLTLIDECWHTRVRKAHGVPRSERLPQWGLTRTKAICSLGLTTTPIGEDALSPPLGPFDRHAIRSRWNGQPPVGGWGSALGYLCVTFWMLPSYQ